MISFQHKVLFVHIPKCAGQSIERAFLRNLGLDWLNRHGLLLRHKERHESGPERLAHLYANEYVKFGYINERDFSRFFKFSIMRDPIDRIISELNFRGVSKGHGGVNSIEEYITKIRNKYDINSDVVRHLEPQVNFIFDDKIKNIIVDNVINFDNIKTGLDQLKIRMGCRNLQFLKENVSQKKNWLRSEISQSDIEFVQKTYELDFEFLANNSTILS
jgi:hypothetical protein